MLDFFLVGSRPCLSAGIVMSISASSPSSKVFFFFLFFYFSLFAPLRFFLIQKKDVEPGPTTSVGYYFPPRFFPQFLFCRMQICVSLMTFERRTALAGAGKQKSHAFYGSLVPSNPSPPFFPIPFFCSPSEAYSRLKASHRRFRARLVSLSSPLILISFRNSILC